ncbi:site-specific DNA-methyltransferase [Tenacibaculum finnmarkense genomovar ulcerans]|uniref:site-specific DNA-methyltransferase n=1 Tax=Tenacibaculum finnmarkense TaxID=2781243 RepID=UPI001E4BB402|nr:site-specific DNA-methyltransferase [Tenacibaculum finnmarkense]MCD8432330.1 site-specific DNA-methyltransferase [Tenacibaculum finnmarkense genomovar ulcerans]
MNKIIPQTKDITTENINKIALLFPQVITEKEDKNGNTIKAIDFELLKQHLSKEIVEGADERYRLDWPGKRASILKANTPIDKTLKPDRESSVNFNETENVYIEGDNFEVLKILQESYLGKIKMIYIDPPYNTGKDFVYKDNFKVSKDAYETQIDTEDKEGGKLFKNTDTNGRFHSDWLSMMYERLLVARDLLTDDGVIFMSIGIEEFANLRSVSNEVFGEENFIEIFSWVKTSTPPALSTKSRKTNEYIICFEKNRSSKKYNGEKLDGGSQPLLNSGNSIRKLIIPKEKATFTKSRFPNGLLKAGKNDRVRLLNNLIIDNGYSNSDIELEGEFKWTQEFLNEELKKGTVFVIKSEKLSIRFIRDEEGYKRPTNFIKEKYTNPTISKKNNNVGTNENSSKNLINLMGGDFFDHPKPINLISYLLKFISKDEDIILDFFSGSATTAHATMQLNAEDGGNRKFIMVQLPEETDEKSEAFKAGYKTITEIGKERIRRAGKKILEENSEKLQERETPLDIGFRVYKTSESILKEVAKHPNDVTQTNLFESEDNIRKDASSEDILTAVLLDFSEKLDHPIEKQVITNSEIFIVDTNALVACFDTAIDMQVVDAMAKMQPIRAVFRDACFIDDKDLINTVESRFKQLAPNTKVHVI